MTGILTLRCDSSNHPNRDAVPPGTFRGGDEVPPGTFRGGDEVPPGTFRGGDEVPPGTFRGKVIYRTKDGQADYGFSIERQPSGNHRVYIDAQPSYRGRSSDGHSTHRYTEGGRNFVCWTEPVRSESEAKQVAAKWADSTQDYIKRGENF
jgi:hypothetical protein